MLNQTVIFIGNSFHALKSCPHCHILHSPKVKNVFFSKSTGHFSLLKLCPTRRDASGEEYSFFRGGVGTIKLHQHWRILFISSAIKPTPTNRKTIKIIEVKTLALLLMAAVVSWVPVFSLDLCQAEAALTSIFWSFFIIFLPAFFTFFPWLRPTEDNVWSMGVRC